MSFVNKHEKQKILGSHSHPTKKDHAGGIGIFQGIGTAYFKSCCIVKVRKQCVNDIKRHIDQRNSGPRALTIEMQLPGI